MNRIGGKQVLVHNLQSWPLAFSSEFLYLFLHLISLFFLWSQDMFFSGMEYMVRAAKGVQSGKLVPSIKAVTCNFLFLCSRSRLLSFNLNCSLYLTTGICQACT